MKKGIVALLSALALMLAITGCGGSQGAFSSGDVSGVDGAGDTSTETVAGLSSFPPVPELPAE